MMALPKIWALQQSILVSDNILALSFGKLLRNKYLNPKILLEDVKQFAPGGSSGCEQNQAPQKTSRFSPELTKENSRIIGLREAREIRSLTQSQTSSQKNYSTMIVFYRLKMPLLFTSSGKRSKSGCIPITHLSCDVRCPAMVLTTATFSMMWRSNNKIRYLTNSQARDYLCTT